MAVRIAVDSIGAILREADHALALEDVLRTQLPGVVAAWRQAVTGDARQDPFTAEETTRSGGADLAYEPWIAYGATLLVAIMRDDEIALAQLGDGDVVVRAHGQDALAPMPGDDRLVGGQTTSLCLSTAAEDFRFAQFSRADDVDLVMLATDGYANSFADPLWWHSVVGDVADFVHSAGPAALSAQLPAWLGESARVGGDDVTAAVLVREPMASTGHPPGSVGPSVPANSTQPIPSASESAQPIASRRRRRPKRAIIVLVGLGVVALAVALAVILLDHSSSNSAPPASTQSVPVPSKVAPTQPASTGLVTGESSNPAPATAQQSSSGFGPNPSSTDTTAGAPTQTVS